MNLKASSALVFLAALLLMPTPVIAEPGFDLTIWSRAYQPSQPVFINVTGPANMSINLYISDMEGNIIIGRNTVLDETGNFSFTWIASQEAEYNATVQFSTGLIIVRKFVIEDKITGQDLGELYKSLFAMERRMLMRFEELTTLVYASILLSVVGMITSAAVFNHVRKHVSRADTELTKFFKGEVASVLQQQLSKKE